MTFDEAYEQWLDGLMLPSKTETRRDFAKSGGVSLADLQWAFLAGWYSRYWSLTINDI